MGFVRRTSQSRISPVAHLAGGAALACAAAPGAITSMIALIGDRDPTTRRMLESILNDEAEHADELKDMLEK